MKKIDESEIYSIPQGRFNRLKEQAYIEDLRKKRKLSKSQADELSEQVWSAGEKSLLRKLTRLSGSEWAYVAKTIFEFFEEEKKHNTNDTKSENRKEAAIKKESYWAGVGRRIDGIGILIDRIIVIVILFIIFFVFKSL